LTLHRNAVFPVRDNQHFLRFYCRV
jgi:hypothetical protein